MQLRIENNMTVSELQRDFNAEFPYLRIEFFDIPNYPGNKLTKAHVYPGGRLLGVCRKKRNEGTIFITADDTVEKLEQALWNDYGLTAEVFRKSGNLWIETSLTNSWTLKLQNEEGKAISEIKSSIDFTSDDDTTDRDKWE